MAGPVAAQGALVGKRMGKYDVLALLAVGGTAEIYLARIAGEAGFQKYVVVKSLLDHLADDAEFVHMFLDEARLGAQLDHSNIVQTLELGQHKGGYYMVMEYLAGMSLAHLVRKAQERLPGSRVPPEIALGLAVQACAGLHYAHQRTTQDGTPLTIVHRDISPQNLVVTFEGILKIVDFGIAKAALRDTHTKTGTIKGKFAYMSPEQCLAKAVDRRTDIFALGTVVHEMITGRRLFKQASAYATYQAIVRGQVSPPSRVAPELDPSVDPLVLRALAYQPDERYPTAEAFGEAILATLHRWGRQTSAGDIAQFIEDHFAAELQEHRQRMRELITGHTTVGGAITWDEPGLDSEVMSLATEHYAGGDEAPTVIREPGSGPARQSSDQAPTRVELDPPSSALAFGRTQETAGDTRDLRGGPAAVLSPLQRPVLRMGEAVSRESAPIGAAPRSGPGRDASGSPGADSVAPTGVAGPVAAKPVTMDMPSSPPSTLNTSNPPAAEAPGEASFAYPARAQPATAADTPRWMVVVAFVLAAMFGAGATLLIHALLV
jgi:serine/threonine-protein kinase